MKNAVNIEVIVLRFPSSLVSEIDHHIEKTELFANRPDFIISATRHYLDRLYHSCGLEYINDDFTKCERIDPKESLNWTKIDLSEIIRTYRTYEGDPIRINVRMPTGFRKKWMYLSKLNLSINNFQDFIRYSVLFYLNSFYLFSIYDFDEHVNEFISELTNEKD